MELMMSRYPADVMSVGNARHDVGAVLEAAGMDDVADAARSVVDELVWNVVLHAETRCVVRLTVEDHLLRIAVADQDRRPPVLRHPNADEMQGRGLMIVDQLADTWGWSPLEGGKVTWAQLRTAHAHAA
jgi:anti-sigma regulatory factor (Ser/Thr protein kinase)